MILSTAKRVLMVALMMVTMVMVLFFSSLASEWEWECEWKSIGSSSDFLNNFSTKTCGYAFHAGYRARFFVSLKARAEVLV
jgi:hypothetical protein